MKMKIITTLIAAVILSGCTVPTVKEKEYAKIDRYEKNIEIEVKDSSLKMALKEKFKQNGWRIIEPKETEVAKYKLTCEHNQKQDKYNVKCLLKESKTSWKVSEVQTMLFRNDLECTAKLVYIHSTTDKSEGSGLSCMEEKIQN